MRTPLTSKSKRLSQDEVGRKHGFRSGLEAEVASQLTAAGIKPKYESVKLKYLRPERSCTYTPDFPVHPNIYFETKGRFLTADRQKLVWVKAQHPHLDIRLIFSNPNSPIRKGSPTTYAMWCDKHGFKYAKKEVPQGWIQEIKGK